MLVYLFMFSKQKNEVKFEVFFINFILAFIEIINKNEKVKLFNYSK